MKPDLADILPEHFKAHVGASRGAPAPFPAGYSGNPAWPQHSFRGVRGQEGSSDFLPETGIIRDNFRRCVWSAG